MGRSLLHDGRAALVARDVAGQRQDLDLLAEQQPCVHLRRETLQAGGRRPEAPVERRAASPLLEELAEMRKAASR
jgi:hypothetical protein